MVWSVPDAAWEDNLAALRAYREAHGTLAAPQAAWAVDKPVGQLMANLRRPGGLGKNPQRARQRAEQLTALDPDWNCPWPLDWQRAYVTVRRLVEEDGATLAELRPGVTVGGEDIGRWLARQTERWNELDTEQQRRLGELGVKPAPRPAAKGGAGKPGARSAAFERGVTAMRAYRAREGEDAVPARGHVELTVIDGQEVPIKLGVWRSNMRSRRTSLTMEQQAVLDELGV